MLKTFAAGLLATALIAGPAFAQTSTPAATPGSAPATSATAPATPNAPAQAAKVTAPAKAKQTVSTGKTATKSVKHVKLHKKSVKRVASRSHVKSGKMHQARHIKSVKSHQAKIAPTKTGTAAKRS